MKSVLKKILKAYAGDTLYALPPWSSHEAWKGWTAEMSHLPERISVKMAQESKE